MRSTALKTPAVLMFASIGGILVAFVWSIIRSGATISPGLSDAYNAAVVWPRVPSGEFSSFYADSALGILVFRVLPLESEQQFLLLSATAAIAAVVALAGWAAWVVPNEFKSRAVRLLLLAPLPAVLFNWLGFYDGFTALAWAAILWAWASGSRLLLALAGILLGLQHFEQGLLGLIALTLVWLAVRGDLREPLRNRTPIWTVFGLAIGKGVLMGTLALNGSELSGRTSGVSAYYREWFITAINTGPMLLWSLFAGSWAIVIAWWLRESHRRNQVLVILAVALALGATLISGDRPRVFIMITAPLLLVLTVALLMSRGLSRRSWLGIETLVWIGPPIALWGSKVVNSNALDHLIVTFSSLSG
jgi:hypothetical protein